MASAKPSANDIDAARVAPLHDTAETDDLDSSDVLVMTVEELCIELQKHCKIPAGSNKPDLQEALLRAIFEPPTVAQDQYPTTPTAQFDFGMKILDFVSGCR